MGALFLASAAQAQNPASPTVSVSIPFAEVRQLAPPSKETSHPILNVTLSDGRQIALPMLGDTWFWKEKNEDKAKDSSLITRDGRWGQALLKPDLSLLPKDATIEKARMEINIGWREKPGSAKITVYRMLSDWSENATWAKPFPDKDAAWNSMKPGADYEAAPAATLEIKEVKTGKITVEGLENLVRGWAKGAPNNGFALQTSGGVVQVNFDSKEAGERKIPPLLLGGPDDLKLFLRPDTALMQRVILRPDDLKGAALRLNFVKPPALDKSAGLSVAVYRPLKSEIAFPPVAGVD